MQGTGIRERYWRLEPSAVPVTRGRPGRKGEGIGSDRMASVSLILIVLVMVVSILAPLLTPYSRDGIDLSNINAAPSVEHILGTDDLGRDLFTRLLYGGRFTLFSAFLSVFIASVAGILLGAAAGYFQGITDHLVTGLIDIFLSVPVFLVILVAAAAFGDRFWAIPIVIGSTSWMETARLTRTKFMQLREEEFVEAARSLGVSNSKILFRHIFPQALSPVIVASTAGFAQAMLIESSLSFLGFGVQPPLPTWGNMLHNAQYLVRTSPAAAFVPGFMIFIVCLSFHYAGRGFERLLALEAE